jgi:hypothetical protein
MRHCRFTRSPRRGCCFRMPGKARRGSAKAADAPRCAAASETTAAPSNATAAKENAPAAATGATATSAATSSTSDAAATTTSAATATTVTSAAAAAARHLREAGGAVFLVEEMERRKTDVGHFLFAKNEALIGYGAQRLRNIGSRNGGCGCATHQRKTQSRGAQCWHTGGFGQTLPLRSLLRPGHVASSMPVFRFELKILRLAYAVGKPESVH